MRRSTIIVFGVAAAAVAAASLVVPSAFASGHDDALDGVRSATRQYRKVERAIDAGYVQFFGCVHEPLDRVDGDPLRQRRARRRRSDRRLDAGGADVRGQGRTATSSSSASSTWSSRTRGTPPTRRRPSCSVRRSTSSTARTGTASRRSTSCTRGRGRHNPTGAHRTTTRRCCARGPRATRTDTGRHASEVLMGKGIEDLRGGGGPQCAPHS